MLASTTKHIRKLRQQRDDLALKLQQIDSQINSIERNCKHEFLQVIPAVFECKHCLAEHAVKGW